MAKLTKEQADKIVARLKERGADRPCPRCGHPDWTLLEGYFSNPIQDDFRGIVLGGPAVPTVGVVCTRCGYVSQHALGFLGLLEGEDEPG